MGLRIILLGQAHITLDGHPVDLPGHRPLALLGYLLLTRKAHRREHLIDLFFDGPDDPQASLRWTLSKLRKAIGSEYLLADRQEVSFNFQSDYWLDVFAFEAGESELYSGDFLTGLYLRDAARFEEWLLFERQRLRGMHQSNLEQQLALYEKQEDFAAVIITAQQLLKLDDLREDWHYVLIHAYARLGKRTAALELFEKLRQTLRKELDADPSPEILALADAIRSGRIVPQVPTRENGTSLPGAALPIDPPAEPYGERVMPGGEPIETASPGPDHPRLLERVFGRVGMVGFSAVFLLAVGLVFGLSKQAPFRDNERSFTGGSSESQQESSTKGFGGKSVRILGPYRDEQASLFQQSMAYIEQNSGIDVAFLSGGEPYEADIKARLESGNLPDIVILSQPGWLAKFKQHGKINDVGTFLATDYLQQQYPSRLLELATVDGQILGVWYTIEIKSLVWYPKQAFEAKNYTVPETWDELIALSDQIVADGGTPWCIGIESGDATGWVGTDWVEDILLRTTSPDTYDRWVSHELPFNSPEIRRAFEVMGQIWLDADYVYGGTVNISKESIFESPNHIFENPPGCYLHKQASFAPSFFPPGVRYGQNYDFFYLPPIDPGFGKPVLGSGHVIAMIEDRPEVREVMRYLTTAKSAEAMIKQGGVLSPHRDTPIEWYPTSADLRYAQILLEADTYRFDGSDLMPDQVGLGSFLRGITDWVGGADLGSVLQEIDDSWPR